MQGNRSVHKRTVDQMGDLLRPVLKEKQKGKVSVGFYYGLLKKLFSTDLAKRLEKAEHFTLSSKRNFYSRGRVIKVPHFIDELRNEEAVRVNRGNLAINIRGKTYTLEEVDIGGGQSVSGKRLHEIKGLEDGLITSKKERLAAYCIWLDPNNRVSDLPYNTPGNLKVWFNGSVKAFSPVVRNKRDKSVNLIGTLITFPVFVSTLLIKGTVYASIELLKVGLRIVSHVVSPLLFTSLSCTALTFGLITTPFLSKQKRDNYFSNYSTVLKAAREIFRVGLFEYIKKDILDAENIDCKLENISRGSLGIDESELKKLNSRKKALLVLNGISTAFELPMIVVRGVVNFSCSLFRAVASFSIGVLTLNPDYFEAAKSLIKQPFLEVRDDILEVFYHKEVSCPDKVEQLIGFEESAFREGIKRRDEERRESSLDRGVVAELGRSLRSTGFSEMGEDSDTVPFIPRSCEKAIGAKAI